MKTKKKRFFVLSEGRLWYFKSDPNNVGASIMAPLGYIVLTRARLQMEQGEGKCSFSIETMDSTNALKQDKKYLLRASDESELKVTLCDSSV